MYNLFLTFHLLRRPLCAPQVRVNEFQLEAFKLILSRLLPALPLTRKLRHRRLYVRGELGVHRLTAPVTVLVCRGNGAAMDVAQELKRASADVPHAAAMQIQEAEQVLNAGSVQIPKRRSSLPSILSNESSNVHLLLYLNKDTFSDGDIGVKGSVAELVLDFMERVRKATCWRRVCTQNTRASTVCCHASSTQLIPLNLLTDRKRAC
eukprot:7090848-Prymnesium_polylepis.2